MKWTIKFLASSRYPGVVRLCDGPGSASSVWMIVGQGPIVLAVGAVQFCFPLSFLSSFSLSLGEGPI